MKKLLLLSFLLFIAGGLFAQKEYYLPEGPLKFTLSNKWLPSPHAKSKHSTVYHYKRLDARDTLGRKVFPEIAIIIEHVPAGTKLGDFSAPKQKPYKDLKNFTVHQEFDTKGGDFRLYAVMGKKCTYEDEDDTQHTFYFFHAIKEHKGIQVVINIPSAVGDVYEEEFLEFVYSLE